MTTPDQLSSIPTEQQAREAHRIPQNQVSSIAFYRKFLANTPEKELSSFNQLCAQKVREFLNAQGRKTESNQAYFSLKDSAIFLDLSVKQLVQLEKNKLFPEFSKIEKNPRIPAWVLLLHRSVETWRNDRLNVEKAFGGEDRDMQQGNFQSLKQYPEPEGFTSLWTKHKKD